MQMGCTSCESEHAREVEDRSLLGNLSLPEPHGRHDGGSLTCVVCPQVP